MRCTARALSPTVQQRGRVQARGGGGSQPSTRERQECSSVHPKHISTHHASSGSTNRSPSKTGRTAATPSSSTPLHPSAVKVVTGAGGSASRVAQQVCVGSICIVSTQQVCGCVSWGSGPQQQASVDGAGSVVLQHGPDCRGCGRVSRRASTNAGGWTPLASAHASFCSSVWHRHTLQHSRALVHPQRPPLHGYRSPTAESRVSDSQPVVGSTPWLVARKHRSTSAPTARTRRRPAWAGERRPGGIFR